MYVYIVEHVATEFDDCGEASEDHQILGVFDSEDRAVECASANGFHKGKACKYTTEDYDFGAWLFSDNPHKDIIITRRELNESVAIIN